MRLSKPSAVRLTLTALLCVTVADVGLAQGTDTLQASCARTEPSPARCAMTRLARRVQARQGASDSLHYVSASTAFADPAGQLVVAARVTLLTDDSRVIARAILSGPSSASPLPLISQDTARTVAPSVPSTGPAAEHATITEPAAVPPTKTVARAPVRKDSTVKAPAPVKAVFVLHGPSAPEPVAVARDMPVALRFRLYRMLAPDSALTTPRKAECVPRKSRGLEIVQSKLNADGELTCWVRLSAQADTSALAVVAVRVEAADHRAFTVDAFVRPVAVTRYAVEVASAACKPLADRILFLLHQRGVPVVESSHATRIVVLEGCDNVGKLLPLRPSDAAAQGVYLRGTIRELGVSLYESPESVGPFEITVMQPGVEPQAAAALEVLDRLLRYRTL